jgi:hypothetical protein
VPSIDHRPILEDHLSVALQRTERSVGDGVVFFAERDMVAGVPQRRDEYVQLADLARISKRSSARSPPV